MLLLPSANKIYSGINPPARNNISIDQLHQRSSEADRSNRRGTIMLCNAAANYSLNNDFRASLSAFWSHSSPKSISILMSNLFVTDTDTRKSDTGKVMLRACCVMTATAKEKTTAKLVLTERQRQRQGERLLCTKTRSFALFTCANRTSLQHRCRVKRFQISHHLTRHNLDLVPLNPSEVTSRPTACPLFCFYLLTCVLPISLRPREN